MAEKQITTRAEIIAWAFAVDWRDFANRPLGDRPPARLPRSLVNAYRQAHPGTEYPF